MGPSAPSFSQVMYTLVLVVLVVMAVTATAVLLTTSHCAVSPAAPLPAAPCSLHPAAVTASAPVLRSLPVPILKTIKWERSHRPRCCQRIAPPPTGRGRPQDDGDPNAPFWQSSKLIIILLWCAARSSSLLAVCLSRRPFHPPRPSAAC